MMPRQQREQIAQGLPETRGACDMLGADAMKLGVEGVEPCAGVHQRRETVDAVVGRNTGQPDLADTARIAAGGFHIQRDETEIAIGDHGAHSCVMISH